jgi:hypothetical protein
MYDQGAARAHQAELDFVDAQQQAEEDEYLAWLEVEADAAQRILDDNRGF